MTIQISALTTTMLAAAVTLAIRGHDWNPRWTSTDGAILVVVFICGSLSYYGSYAASTVMLSMISQKYIYIYQPRLQLFLSLQYYSFLLGVFLLGLVFVRMMQIRVNSRMDSAQP